MTPLLFALACGGSSDAGASADVEAIDAPANPAVRVETARLESTGASLSLSLPGEIEGARDAQLASAQGGFVESVLVKTGDMVRKGQTLARINTSVYSAQKDQAAAQAELAESELGRVESLGDLASASQIQQTRTQATVANASLRLAEVSLARSVITAPFAGVVGEVGIERGEIATPGSPVMRVVQLNPVHVTVSVSDRDVVSLTEGLEVTVVTPASGRTHTGKIANVPPAADLQTRSFTVEIEVPNPDHALLPGMIANVQINEELEGTDVVIPQDWLVTGLEEVGVYLHKDGKALWRPVDLGKVIYDQVQVTSGLSPDDELVITGHRALTNGDPLLVARAGVCCDGGRVRF